MKNRASCKHLTYKHSPFWGCTVGEAVMVFVLLFVGDLCLSTIISVLIGYWFLFFMTFFIASSVSIKLILKWVGISKKDKQHGFLLLKLKKTVLDTLNIRSATFINGEGIWSKRRGI